MKKSILLFWLLLSYSFITSQTLVNEMQSNLKKRNKDTIAFKKSAIIPSDEINPFPEKENQTEFQSNEILKNPNNDELLIIRSGNASDAEINLAYGIIKNGKSLSSVCQLIGNYEVNNVRETNINSILSGRIAGIQYRGQSTMKLNDSGNIRIRGEGGLSEGQIILYLVDGIILDNPSDIITDNIETIQVLSGPTACAIYGPKGSNGIVSIKTRKTGKKKNEIELNTGVIFSNPYIIPKFQNSYAGGSSMDLLRFTWFPSMPDEWKPLDGKYYHDYINDVSWGPRMAGQEYIPWYAWYPGTKYTGKTAKLYPEPQNIRDFYNNGMTANTSIAFSKSEGKYNLRLTYSNINTLGLIPNSSLKKNMFTFFSSVEITNKLKFMTNLNYSAILTEGEFDDGFGNPTTGIFNQWFHRNLNMGIMKELRSLETLGVIDATWNHGTPYFDPSWISSPEEVKYFVENIFSSYYWKNPYTYLDEQSITDKYNNMFGNFAVEYKIVKNLSGIINFKKQLLSSWREKKDSTNYSHWYSHEYGSYSTLNQYKSRDNFEILLNYLINLAHFQLDLYTGADYYYYNYRSNGASTSYGLFVPDLFTITNSRNIPLITNIREKEKSKSVFFNGNLSFKDFLFADLSLRNDWMSVLPPEDNSLFSKSFGVSFLFSKFLKTPKISFSKIRLSWGQVPTAIGINEYPGNLYMFNQYNWGENQLMTAANNRYDNEIKGSTKSQTEIGFDISFFKNKLCISTTYWFGNEKGIPFKTNEIGFSGYNSIIKNSGEIAKKGLEVILIGIPIQTSNFIWEISTSFGYLIDNKIIKIADGIDKIYVSGLWTNVLNATPRGGAPVMIHEAGRQWGELYGGSKKMIENKFLLDENGHFIQEPDTYFGNVLPDLTGGLQSSLRFLNHFTFSFNIDYQMGGKYFSLSNMWGTYSGLLASTAAINDKGIPVRDKVIDGGGIHVTGVHDSQDYLSNPHGEPILEDVDIYLEAKDYFENLYNIGVQDDNVFDLSYIKLREINLEYSLSTTKLRINKWVSHISVALIAQNPWLIYAKNRNFDPSEISSVSGESAQFPSVRSFGFNLKFIF
ncbi:MAG: TonB-dependent receptor plug domain-containing protein [Bacteroidales bacterium]